MRIRFETPKGLGQAAPCWGRGAVTAAPAGLPPLTLMTQDSLSSGFLFLAVDVQLPAQGKADVRRVAAVQLQPGPDVEVDKYLPAPSRSWGDSSSMQCPRVSMGLSCPPQQFA